jgi:hypothetical protein
LKRHGVPRVFLSHSSVDKPFVRKLARFIERVGLQVWLDERAMAPGDQLAREISEGLAASEAVIFVISAASGRSNWLRYELNNVAPRAVAGECLLVPVVIEDATLPSELHGLIYADFRSNAKKGYEAVRAALQPLVEEREARERAARQPETREEVVRAALASIFNRSSGRRDLNFSGRANEEDPWYRDDIRLVYEPADKEPTLFSKLGLGDEGDHWREKLSPDIDENYAFDLGNLTATEGYYYYLLVADRRVSFKYPERLARSDRKGQVKRHVGKADEPASITVALDVCGVTDVDQLKRYFALAREVYRADCARWVANKWPDGKLSKRG